jgi:putative DNA primase/helicase
VRDDDFSEEHDDDAEDGGGWVLPKGMHYTLDDEGNADRLIDRCGEDIRYVKGRGWFVWEKASNTWLFDEEEIHRRWGKLTGEALAECERAMKPLRAAGDGLEPAEKAQLSELKLLKKHLNNSRNMARIRGCMEVAQHRSEVLVELGAMDKANADLNCGNAIVRLKKTGAEFIRPNKARLFTKHTSVELRKGAVSAEWDGFLDTFLPEPEIRAWAQKVAGYTLFGENPERLLVFCWGPTSSGKSTFVELMMQALGSYAGPFSPSLLRDNQDERARGDLVAAFERRFIVASELSSSWRLHADMIKRITGQDRMQARLPHASRFIEMVPRFTPWIVTNNTPTIEEADQALYRRLCVVLFPHTISEEEEVGDFRQKFLDDSDGGRAGRLQAVLWWLVEGWDLYAKEGLLDAPEWVSARQMQIRDEFSDFDIFLAEHCECGPAPEGYHEDRKALYEAYCEWHTENNGHPRDALSGTMFGRRLSMRGFEAKQKKIKGRKIWRRLGIRLKVGHIDL